MLDGQIVFAVHSAHRAGPTSIAFSRLLPHLFPAGLCFPADSFIAAPTRPTPRDGLRSGTSTCRRRSRRQSLKPSARARFWAFAEGLPHTGGAAAAAGPPDHPCGNAAVGASSLFNPIHARAFELTRCARRAPMGFRTCLRFQITPGQAWGPTGAQGGFEPGATRAQRT